MYFIQWRGITSQTSHVDHSVYALGVEATWRLQDWGALENMLSPNDGSDVLLRHNNVTKSLQLDSELIEIGTNTSIDSMNMDDMLTLSWGKMLVNMLRGDEKKFKTVLSDARQRVMSFLSAASMESYSRCYSGLVQLHVLQELEQGYELHNKNKNKNDSCAEDIIQQTYEWDRRLTMLSPSFKQRSKVLSARRSILSILHLRGLVANNWLSSCQALRQMNGRLDTAMISLRHAEVNGLPAEDVLLEECQLIKDSGDIRKALMLLEPDSHLLERLITLSNSHTKKKPALPFLSEADAKIIAGRLLLATRWMVESKLAHGREIMDRYKVVLYLQKDWEDALFYLAKYFDELFESKFKELKQKNQTPSDEDKSLLQFAVQAVEYYGKCIHVGTNYIMQTVPKFLSVYFTLMAVPSGHRGSSHRSGQDPGNTLLGQAQKALSQRAKRYMSDIPAYKWYTCMPQIVSRVGHRSPDAISLVKGILHNILVAFPEQGIWHLSPLLHSMNQERATIGRSVLKTAIQSLEKQKKYESSSMLQQSILLFSNLVELAQNQPKDRRIRWSIGTECQLTSFLVPSRSALSIAFPSPDTINDESGVSPYFPSDEVRNVLYKSFSLCFLSMLFLGILSAIRLQC